MLMIPNSEGRAWGDQLGMLTMLLTFSPLGSDVIVQLSEGLGDVTSVAVVRLHEMNSETDMSKKFNLVCFHSSSYRL